MANPDDDEPRARDLVATPERTEELDPETRAQLERWFGLPSYTQLEEEGADDPDLAESRERIARACAAVDPALVAHVDRWTSSADGLLKFEPLDLGKIDPSISAVDDVLVERAGMIADPREVALPQSLINDLADCTPQAVLRDIHRPELQFEIRYEVDQAIAEVARLDVRETIDRAMRTRIRIEFDDGPTALDEMRAALADLAALKAQPWKPIPSPNRRVEE
jgi:hypothetical protein